MEKFEHLGFLIYFGEKGSEKTPLSQNAPFFANSDPDMPAAPVPASQVHDWISQNISDALDRISERAAAKENGQTSPSDQDVQMTDVSPNFRASTSAKGPSFIEGISKQSYVKQAPEIKGSFVKVSSVLPYTSCEMHLEAIVFRTNPLSMFLSLLFGIVYAVRRSACRNFDDYLSLCSTIRTTSGNNMQTRVCVSVI